MTICSVCGLYHHNSCKPPPFGFHPPERRADAAASGGVRSKPLLAGERSDARGKGETGGQAPCVSGASAASAANNHNTLDNRKANLRLCSAAENARNNRGHRVKRSKYKGVVYMLRRAHLPTPWCAQIGHAGRTFNLGCYATQEAAAQVYNDKAVELFGEFAHLNKISPAPH